VGDVLEALDAPVASLGALPVGGGIVIAKVDDAAIPSVLLVLGTPGRAGVVVLLVFPVCDCNADIKSRKKSEKALTVLGGAAVVAGELGAAVEELSTAFVLLPVAVAASDCKIISRKPDFCTPLVAPAPAVLMESSS
jgi:hypothetical protein